MAIVIRNDEVNSFLKYVKVFQENVINTDRAMSTLLVNNNWGDEVYTKIGDSHNQIQTNFNKILKGITDVAADISRRVTQANRMYLGNTDFSTVSIDEVSIKVTNYSKGQKNAVLTDFSKLESFLSGYVRYISSVNALMDEFKKKFSIFAQSYQTPKTQEAAAQFADAMNKIKLQVEELFKLGKDINARLNALRATFS